ncbi:MAG: protein kinase domain-containing protein [Anaerolineae bacterium]
MEIGRILGGRYKIEERIGSGGMSVVYRAHEVGLDREVAVKVLLSTLSGDEQLIERFNREAKTIASLQHNSIIPIYYYGVEADFGSYLIMPMLQGGTLEQRLQQLDLLPSLTEVGEIAEKLGNALQYAHDKGVVHRDIKFSNIMFDDAGSPYLMDFGIAKLLNTTNLTGTGMTVGTPNFMPPEQWRNDAITPAVDQYAFAVLMYAMLTRRMPFEADSAPALMYKHLQEPPPLITNHREDVPEAIAQALDKALSKAPEDRFDSISEFTQIVSESALASTRRYSGFFKATINVRNENTPTTPRIQNVMPNTPTEMVAEGKSAPVDIPVPPDGGAEQTVNSGSSPSPRRAALLGGLMTIILIGVLLVGGVLYNNQITESRQATETTIAEVAASATADANSAATGTMVAFEAQSATETQAAQPTASETPTVTPTASETPTVTPTASETPTVTPTASETPTATVPPTETPDSTQTQQALDLTAVAIAQVTSNAELAETATALALIQTETAAERATTTAEASIIQTERANNAATSTALADQRTQEALNDTATEQALNRDGTATAIAVIQANLDATATQIAERVRLPEIEIGEAVTDFGDGQTELSWVVTAEQGDRLSFAGRSPTFDIELAIYQGDELIISDDNSGYLDNPRITNLRIEEDGAYIVTLRASDADDLIGAYSLGVTQLRTCPDALPSRVLVGELARVTLDGLSNNLRTNPTADSSRLDQIPAGGVFTVLAGPVCNDGFTWYRVQYGNNVGWTAEGDAEDYWLEQLPDDDEPVLLVGGRGLTNSRPLDAGTFQVESFCSRRGLVTGTDEIDWFCANSDDVTVITLTEEDFDQICQDTYNEDEAFARQDGDASEPAYRWRCYYYPQ